jgi:CBS domain-containing protein
MNTSPVKVDPETNIREVVDLMLLHRVGAIPVTDLDTGDLLGIVSYVDLLRVLQEMLEAET